MISYLLYYLAELMISDYCTFLNFSSGRNDIPQLLEILRNKSSIKNYYFCICSQCRIISKNISATESIINKLIVMINESPLSVKTAYTFDSNYFNSENKIIFILAALQ